MKQLFSKTVQVNELAQISVIEDQGKGIIIQGLNYYYDPMKAVVQNMRLTTEAAEILKHLLQDWSIVKEKEKEEAVVEEPVPDKEQEKIIWETVRLQKELGIMKERFEEYLEGFKVGKNQVEEGAELIRKWRKYINELEDKLNCLAGR